MGVNENNETNSVLSELELYQNVFEKIEPNLVISSFEESQGSKQGDNYTAALYRVSLSGYTLKKNEGKKSKWEKVVICKRLPDSPARREAYKSENLFRNEVEFYNCILPTWQNFQRSNGIDPKEIFKAVPKCFYAQEDLIILEDLCLRDFKMQNRVTGLTYAQIKVVFTELAKFHCISLSYKSQFPVEFEKLRKKISEGIFKSENAEWYKNYYKALTKNAIDMVTQKLSDESHYVKKMKEFCTNFFPKIVTLLENKTKLAVLCHGDCWTNNVLFHYNGENESIAEMCFVDFQLMRYGSITLDLANVLYCSADSEIRKKYKNVLIRHYYEELVKYLKLYGPIPKELGSEGDIWTLIQDEFKTFAKFGLGLGMDMLPISTCSSEEAPDVYNEEEEAVTYAPELNVPVNEICRQKMTDLLVELVDEGLI